LVSDKGKTAYKLQATRHDKLKVKEIRTKEVRERQREGRGEDGSNPFFFFVPHLPFYLFYLVLIGLLT
jgi:hypothetical protein